MQQLRAEAALSGAVWGSCVSPIPRLHTWQLYSVRELNKGHRRSKLHLGLRGSGTHTKPCPAKRCPCFKAHLSSKELRNTFCVCFTQKLLHCGHNYVCANQCPCGALGKDLFSSAKTGALPSPCPQQSPRLVNPALHRTQQASLAVL